jgi:trans-aconitate methyltransferase
VPTLDVTRAGAETALTEAVFRRFAPAGTLARYFARGKLRHDPIYFALLRQGGLPDELRLLDLGCGQGLLLALLVESRDRARAGTWPSSWPRPPSKLALRGIELRDAEVLRARRALGPEAAIDALDLREAALGSSNWITAIDVIHYLEPDAQDHLLARIASALVPGGLLTLRVCGTDAGLRAFVTRTADQLGTLAKGAAPSRIYLRSAAHWLAALESLGLSAQAEPMSDGTPFANVCIAARKPER